MHNKGKVIMMKKMLITILSFVAIFIISCGDEDVLLDEEEQTVETAETTVFVSPEAENAEDDFVSDEVLIKFAPGTSTKAIDTLNAQNGASIKSNLEKIGVKVLKVPDGKVREKMETLKKHPKVAFVEPNYRAHVMAIASAQSTPSTNDPDYPNQWGMDKINIVEAWSVTKGDARIKIAILDTGIDRNHIDLADKIIAEKDFTGGNNPDDLYGHGTHVAGISAAVTNNGIGVVGAGHDCYLMNAKVLGDDGSGDHASIVEGIAWAVDNGAKVINMSLGSFSSTETLRLAVEDAWKAGCVIIAAAGNEGVRIPMYPAYYEDCIAVGASNERDIRSSFSNHGDWVDVAAPGVDIWSTLPDHPHHLDQAYNSGLNYGYLSGTSMAAPHVAGLAGLVWTTAHGLLNITVRMQIENTCVPVTGRWAHFGIIDAFQAVK